MDTIKEFGSYIGAGTALVATAFFDKIIFFSFMYVTKLVSTGVSNMISWF
jgi:hypothetical protein